MSGCEFRAWMVLDWVIYAKRPFPEQVLAYLGHRTHRVAIANSRLATLDDTQVGSRWKDYRHHCISAPNRDSDNIEVNELI